MFETLQPLDPELTWVLCISIIIAFLLAFSIGANDVSNSFGTSVGSKVITVTQACILATFFEVAGSTLLGYSVCDRIRRDIYDVGQYDGQQRELMFGLLACIMGSATWNLTATALKMPISGTHSIIGSAIGFSLVLKSEGIKLESLGKIALSWFLSPFFAGLLSSLIYVVIFKLIMSKEDPIKEGLEVLPIFYGFTVFINIGSIIIQARDENQPPDSNWPLPWYFGLLLSLLPSVITICLVAVFLRPRLRAQMNENQRILNARQSSSKLKQIESKILMKRTKFSKGHDNAVFEPDSKAPEKREGEICLDPAKLLRLDESKNSNRPPIAPKPLHLKREKVSVDQEMEEIDLSEVIVDTCKSSDNSKDDRQSQENKVSVYDYNIAKLFSWLQIMTACFASFAHGTNDVSNAVSPLVPIWNIYANGFEDTNQQTPLWILVFGGIGICTGLWAWGRSVMETVGGGLTKLTPAKGFAIELGSAMAVLTATKIGMPISTTHCKVGSVVIVGFVSSKFLSLENSSAQHAINESSGEEEKPVDWKLFGNIAFTWIVTVPLAAISSAVIMQILLWCAF